MRNYFTKDMLSYNKVYIGLFIIYIIRYNVICNTYITIYVISHSSVCVCVCVSLFPVRMKFVDGSQQWTGESYVVVYEVNGSSEVETRKWKAALLPPHLAIWVEDLAISFCFGSEGHVNENKTCLFKFWTE